MDFCFWAEGWVFMFVGFNKARRLGLTGAARKGLKIISCFCLRRRR
jgi:hypothetical protein